MFDNSTLVKTQVASLIVLILCIVLNQIFHYYEESDEFSGKNLLDRYDYIIVGGGTSGSVLASRLSEDKNATILLIEAGDTPEKNNFIDAPIFTDRQKDGPYDWSYKTVPQQHSCKGHIGKAAKWHSGKGLGGSSNLNYMEYMRGSRHDYDAWIPKHAAHHKWSYKEVLPYFIKSEDQRNKEFIKTVFHGFGGMMTVIDAYTSTLTRLLKKSFEEFGLKKKDLNGKNQFGWSPIQATIRNGVRWGTYRAFLKRAIFRDNLHVVTMATADKILFEGTRANAVKFRHGNKSLTISSSREILLTAGTIGSAKLLLLSGVGPEEHLAQLKIPLVANLPVGENLRDQVAGDGVEFHTPHDDVAMSVVKADHMMSSLVYNIFGSGMRSTPRFREVVANIRTRRHPSDIKHPLISLRFVASTEVFTSHQVLVDPKVWNEIHGLMNIDTKEGFTVFPVLLHPRSVGTLRLRSTDPDDDPLIDPNYLSDEMDVKSLADAYRFIRKLKNTKTFREHAVTINNRLISTCSHLGNYSSEAYLKCHLRHITLPGLSPTGTCKMGTPDDPTAVVDDDLRVMGIEGLRVVDASVIPSTLTGNSYTTQVMIGERAADIISNKNSVKAIKEYFHHLITMRHKKILEED